MSSQATSWAEVATGAGFPDLPFSAQSDFSGGARERRQMFTSVNSRFLFCSYFSTSSSQIFAFHFSLLHSKRLWPTKSCYRTLKLSSSLLLRDHHTLYSWVSLEGSQAAESFQHHNTVPPLSGSGKAMAKAPLPVWQELAGACIWVTGHVQNICRQHHPLMETSMYIESNSLRQGPLLFNPQPP